MSSYGEDWTFRSPVISPSEWSGSWFGFRASELRILTPANFDLDTDPPTVTAGAAYSKRRRDDVQPIRPELAELLRPWLADKPVGKPVFPMPEKTAKMMRVDLKAAGIPCYDSAGRVVDFHSLRHTYVSCIVDSGASVKVAQELARHSTPTLTVGRYAHTRFHDLTEALANVPVGDMSSEKVLAVGATGTDDAESGTGAAHAQRAGRETMRIPAARCDTGSSAHEVCQKDKPLCIAADSETMRQDATQRENTLGRIRTCDLRIRSPLTPPKNTQKNRVSRKIAAPGAARSARNLAHTLDVNAVVAAWPALPEAVRVGISAMVNAALEADGK